MPESVRNRLRREAEAILREDARESLRVIARRFLAQNGG
jgi:hypothetical protein